MTTRPVPLASLLTHVPSTRTLLVLLCGLLLLGAPDRTWGQALPEGIQHLEVWFDSTVVVDLDHSGQVSVSTTDKQPLQSTWLTTVRDQGGRWRRVAALPDSLLQRLRETAERRLTRSIPDFRRMFILSAPDEKMLLTWRNDLKEWPYISFAEPLPRPLQPPVPPDFAPDQGYLASSPVGLGFEDVWQIPGGTGKTSGGDRVKICDVEYNWNLLHNDLPAITTLVPPGMTAYAPFPDDNHGTAVMGELVSRHDSVGTVGAVYEAMMFVAPTGLDSAWQVGAAILNALTVLSAGDVLVIEHEMTGPTGTPVPIEWWPSWYAAVVTAVGNGVHVVEAAGNGANNLDSVVFATGNGGHWPFLPENNSGAIIVGAGAAPVEFGGTDTVRSRLSFSNYGSRVDVQSWGEMVATTGYGYAYPLEGKNYWYTKTFSGTSSATPMAAAVVAALEGIYRDATEGDHLDPLVMRELLTSTGLAQQNGSNPATEHIGPLPDVMAAYAALPILCCEGTTGNIDCDAGQVVTLTDLTRLINHLFVTFAPLCCPGEGNVNADPEGVINLTDVTVLANHLFVTFEPLPPCPLK